LFKTLGLHGLIGNERFLYYLLIILDNMNVRRIGTVST